jgi:Rieske Fe-S protein
MKLFKIQFFLILFFIFLFHVDCKRKEDNVVPYTKVNFTIFLGDPDFVTLQTVGNYVYVTGGVAGIIIYRKSLNEFVAIERCCTHNPNDRCAVLVDSTNTLQLHCRCCNSRFSIMNGSVLSGIASRNLTLYETSYNEVENTLHVYN